MVLNGKATNQRYPAVHFWAWNSPLDLKPTRINKKTQSLTFDVGFPSVYQTSEHFRYDLTQRPGQSASIRPKQLGIGHTVHISKFVYNTVWSVYYTFTETRFNPSRGVGKQTMKYIMTVLSIAYCWGCCETSRSRLDQTRGGTAVQTFVRYCESFWQRCASLRRACKVS